MQRVWNVEAALIDQGFRRSASLCRRGGFDHHRLAPGMGVEGLRARVAIATGELERLSRDAYDALTAATEIKAYRHLPDVLESLAVLAGEAGRRRSHPDLRLRSAPSGNAWAWSGSRPTTTITRPR